MSDAQTPLPDPADFSVKERPNEYEVSFRVSGTVTRTIIASSKQEAREKAEQMIDDEDFDGDLDEAGEVEIDYISKHPDMYRVTRGGKNMQVSHLRPGDLPREPDERGF